MRPVKIINEWLLFAVMLGVGFVVFGIVSVSLGQDNNWDLRNYHYYNPYSFLTGRMSVDVAPAQMQNYFNPVSDLPYYFFINHLPPWWVGFLAGGIHGLAFGLVFLIAFHLLAGLSQWSRIGLSVLCAGVGLYGPVFIGELGASQNDSLFSLFVLGAVLVLVRRFRTPEMLAGKPGLIALTLAGALTGLAVGLKETNAVYAVGMAVGLLIVECSWTKRLRALGIWTGAVVIAFLLIRGFWLVELQNRFGNPLFPYYNNIFRSPWAEVKDLADMRYMPASLGEALVRPFIFITKNHYTDICNEYRDARYAVIYVLLLGSLAAWFVRRSRQKKNARHDETAARSVNRVFLTAFFVATYLIWQVQFSIVRYTATMEALGPLLILILTLNLVRQRWLQSLIVAGAFLFIVVNMQALNHNKYERLPWTKSFWGVQVPAISDPEHTLVIIAGGRPWAYLIPFFPPNVRFIRVESNFTHPRSPTRMQEEIRSILQTHNGPLYLLSRPQYLPQNNDALSAYQLSASNQNAQPVHSKHEPAGLFLFPVTRRSS